MTLFRRPLQLNVPPPELDQFRCDTVPPAGVLPVKTPA
jgi:hypothetical protein